MLRLILRSYLVLLKSVCINTHRYPQGLYLPAHAASTQAIRQAIDIQLHQLPFVLELL